MTREQENIIRVGELSRELGVEPWHLRRLEKRGVIPRSKRMERGKVSWRYWLKIDLKKIKEKFYKYENADSFLERHKINMDRSNRQIEKFLREIVISHTIIHREEKISEVIMSFHFNKGEQPKAFEVIDIYHQEK